jgi:hypothetical protein
MAKYIDLDNSISQVVVIGNGFDLNQGLKTSYNDFIKSPEFINLTSLRNNLALHLKNKHQLNNWIDIENELKVYSVMGKMENLNESYQREFKELCNSLISYLKRIDYSNLNILAPSYQLIQKITQKDFLILDFNYTDTVSIMLQNLGFREREIESKLIKVHGSVKENQIIFGVEDDAKIKREHVFLRKAFNNHFKSIDFENHLDQLTDLYFFGHSLGETDHTYFTKFFGLGSLTHNKKSGKNIFLYYYGEMGYKQLFMQLDKLTEQKLTGFKQVNNFKTIDTSK